MNSRFSIFKSIFYYGSSSYIVQFIGLLSNIVVAKLLGPAEFGIWTIVILILTYGAYTEIGAISVMGRDLPMYLGQKDVKKANKLKSAARYISTSSSILAGILIFFFSILFVHSDQTRVSFQAAAIILVLQQIYTYHRIILRSSSSFRELSQQQIIFVVITAFLSISFVSLSGLNGRLIAALIAHILIILYAIYRHPWEKLKVNSFKVNFSVVKVGIPIVFSGLIITMLTSIDRIMVGYFLGDIQLGYISLSLFLVSFVSIIPQVVVQVLQPKFNFLYGSSGKNISSLKEYIFLPSRLLSGLLPLIIGPLFLVLPFMVNNILEDYIPGIQASRIVLLGIYFYGILGLTETFMITVGKIHIYVIFGCIAVFFNILIDYFFIKLGYGIEGVAIGGTMATYLLYSFMMILYTISNYLNGIKQKLHILKEFLLPFLYMLTCLWVAENSIVFFKDKESDLFNQFTLIFFKLFIYITLFLPLTFYIFRSNNIKLSIFNLKNLFNIKKV
jgi:O-antigen/teichoic acid export membrane protein